MNANRNLWQFSLTNHRQYLDTYFVCMCWVYFKLMTINFWYCLKRILCKRLWTSFFFQITSVSANQNAGWTILTSLLIIDGYTFHYMIIASMESSWWPTIGFNLYFNVNLPDTHCHNKNDQSSPGVDKTARKKLIIASILCLSFMLAEAVGMLLFVYYIYH